MPPNQRSGAVAELRGISSGDRAALFEYGLQARERFERCLPGRLVDRDDVRTRLAPDFDRDDLVIERATGLGLPRPLVRAQRETILVLTAEGPVRRAFLAPQAHRSVAVRVDKAVAQIAILESLLAERNACADATE